jgi:hypothetical protein
MWCESGRARAVCSNSLLISLPIGHSSSKSRLSLCNRSNAHREHTASMLLLAELHRPPSPRRTQHLPPRSLPALTQSRLFVLLTVKLSGESFTSGSVSSARPLTGNIWQRWSGGARASSRQPSRLVRRQEASQLHLDSSRVYLFVLPRRCGHS